MADAQRRVEVGRRVVWGVLLAAVCIGALVAGGIPFILLVLLATGALCYEWARLCGFDAASPAGLLLIAGGLAGVGALALSEAFRWALPGAGALAAAVLAAGLLAGQRRRAISLAAGVVYFAPTAVALIWLRLHADGGALFLGWVFVVTWAADTGAFAAGRTFGGPKLAPAISPAKTWSGLAGGLGTAAVVGGAYAALVGWSFVPAALAGIAFGLVAAFGDLFESFLKRRFAVKDTSHLIPGHGGALDRLDSLLWAVPALGLAVLAGLRFA